MANFTEPAPARDQRSYDRRYYLHHMLSYIDRWVEIRARKRIVYLHQDLESFSKQDQAWIMELVNKYHYRIDTVVPDGLILFQHDQGIIEKYHSALIAAVSKSMLVREQVKFMPLTKNTIDFCEAMNKYEFRNFRKGLNAILPPVLPEIVNEEKLKLIRERWINEVTPGWFKKYGEIVYPPIMLQIEQLARLKGKTFGNVYNYFKSLRKI